MRDRGGDQRAAQIARRVGRRQLRGHGIAKNLPDEVERALGTFMPALLLDGPQGKQNFQRLYFGNGALAQDREDKLDEPTSLHQCRLGKPFALLLLQQHLGYPGKAVLGAYPSGCLRLLLLKCGVKARRMRFAGLIPKLPRALQRDVRISAQGQQLFYLLELALGVQAVDPELHTPQSTAAGADQQEQPAFVRHLERLGPRLQSPDFRIRKRHRDVIPSATNRFRGYRDSRLGVIPPQNTPSGARMGVDGGERTRPERWNF